MSNRSLYLHLPSWRLGDYCALYVVIWAITPILSREEGFFRYTAVVASFVWLLTVLPHRRGKLTNYALVSGVLIMCLLINIGFFGGRFYVAIPQAINLAVNCMLGIISAYYFGNEQKKFRSFALVVLVMYVLISIPSIIAVKSNMYVLRNASGLTIRTGIERYAGSYGYSFGCLFVVIFLIYDLRISNYYNGIRKIIQMALIVLFGYIVLNSGFTTALVLLVIGVFAAVFYPKKNAVLASFIMMLAALIMFMVIPISLKWIVDNINLPGVYRAKIVYLSQLADSSTDVTYADSTRGGMFYDSLDALVKYPILGSYIIAGGAYSTGHAVLLDYLVNHGVLFLLFYLYTIIGGPWRLMRGDRTLQMLYITMIILLGLTDTIDYATIAVPMFIGPMIVMTELEHRKGIIHEDSMVDWN